MFEDDPVSSRGSVLLNLGKLMADFKADRKGEDPVGRGQGLCQTENGNGILTCHWST